MPSCSRCRVKSLKSLAFQWFIWCSRHAMPANASCLSQAIASETTHSLPIIHSREVLLALLYWLSLNSNILFSYCNPTAKQTKYSNISATATVTAGHLQGRCLSSNQFIRSLLPPTSPTLTPPSHTASSAPSLSTCIPVQTPLQALRSFIPSLSQLIRHDKGPSHPSHPSFRGV